MFKLIVVFFFISRVQCVLYEGDSCVSGDKFNGTCTKLQNCLLAVRDIKMKNKHPRLCSYNDTEPIVCCTDCYLDYDARDVFFSETGEFFFKSGSKAEDKCLEYITLWEYDCELEYSWLYNVIRNERKKCYSFVNKVLGGGGVPAYRGEYPHMALLGYGDELDDAKWLCGGSVISHWFILTAAHCTEADKIGPVRFVALGILKRSDPPELWQRYHVKRIIPHPKYKSPIKYHDIALLEVSTIIQFSNVVLPACLKVNKKHINNLKNATATGWGALGPREQLADNLQAMSLNKFTAEECAEAYPAYRNLETGIDNESQICFGAKERIVDTCQGDSGGPLQVASSYSECATEIVGVTSFGSPCGNLGTAGVYTLVTNYISWIEEIVWP